MSLPPARHWVAPRLALPQQRVIGLAPGHRVAALVVDDVAENRRILAEMLAAIGAQVETAADGREALARVASRRPDIIFMDIWMPEMDGLEAARRLRDRWGEKAPELVAVTASVLPHERRQYLEAGFDHFIAKPLSEEALYECLAKLLRVEYRYAEEGIEAFDLTGLKLPAGLHARLRQAAAASGLTELEEALEEVRLWGPHGPHLAEQLRLLVRNIDMDAVLDLLEKIEYE
ncbi:MAG: response regulator [Candidatus Latescibacteria bacterium]|nr:response regulator [Candidatus Latescibacterota bacterium]